MKLPELILSLFLLLRSGTILVNGFQFTSPLTPASKISRVKSSSYHESNVIDQNRKIRRHSQWTGEKNAGLYMAEDSDAAAKVASESSSDEVSPEVEATNDDGVVSTSSTGDKVTGNTEPSASDVVEKRSDEVPVFFASPPEAPESSETPATPEASTDSQTETSASDSVAFFASKPEPADDEKDVEQANVSDDASYVSDAVASIAEAEDSSDDSSEALDESTTGEEADMSVKEILAVAEEMKEMTETLPTPVKEKQPVEMPLESIKKTSKKVIEFINSPPPPPTPKTEDDEKIEAFVKALGQAARGTSKELAMGILGRLRTTAANALTQSLPGDERAKLLERMNVLTKAEEGIAEDEEEDEEDKEEDTRASVAEEIAAAKAEQARRSEELWEAEKEALVKQMEEAANARVENELAIQKERLINEMKQMEDSLVQSKQQLDVEKTKLEQQLVDMDKHIEEMKVGSQEVDELQGIIDKREKQKSELAKVEDDLRVRLEEIEKQKKRIAERSLALQAAEMEAAELEATKAEDTNQAEVATETETKEEKPTDVSSVHPVLGPMICDMGYKRIYLTSSETLGSLPIWKKQRIYRHSRARAMALDKAKDMGNGFPGAIGLAEDSEGNLSVLDGQHRIGMMQMLREMENAEAGTLSPEITGYFEKVLVEVYPNLKSDSVEDEKHAESIFLEINKAEPVKLVDMPGVASARDNKIITQAVERLEEQFPKMFSATQKCRLPNVNVDNMRNNIFGANIMKRHRLRSGKQLFDWLLVQNAAVGASYELDVGRREAISESAWQKASENAFYLGLESSWLYM
ncbi:unnamed protein product [Cylindrotheca closterium]|uniref:ParB/Sulfiredoxin domain-containing protein n=1 Tax=Cylindrotheca closterium TaxID=2856 RepID=A0AAD2FPQ9_9STRA|nr:unnamed protein product [Cylindrotheca closterium]